MEQLWDTPYIKIILCFLVLSYSNWKGEKNWKAFNEESEMYISLICLVNLSIVFGFLDNMQNLKKSLYVHIDWTL